MGELLRVGRDHADNLVAVRMDLEQLIDRLPAVAFVEYLTTDQAQRIFAEGNNEFPVVEGVAPGPVVAAAVVAEPGDLTFTSTGAATETVVLIKEGVFTAIAAGTLVVDTDAPDEATGAITTRLTSSTGTVTSVAPFTTLLGVPLDLVPGAPIDPDVDLEVLMNVGPLFVLDPPSEYRPQRSSSSATRREYARASALPSLHSTATARPASG